MANRAAHLTVGTAVGIGLAAYLARDEQPVAFATETAGGAIGGVIGSLSPDWIEPALHSWHRSIAHSCTAASGLATATVRCLGEWQQHCRARATFHDDARASAATDAERLWHGFMAFAWRFLSGFLAGFPTGYLSHLGMDACTPRGIPVIV